MGSVETPNTDAEKDDTTGDTTETEDFLADIGLGSDGEWTGPPADA